MKVVKTTASSESNYTVNRKVSQRVKRKRRKRFSKLKKTYKFHYKMPSVLLTDKPTQKCHKDEPQNYKNPGRWWYENQGSSSFWDNYHRVQMWSQQHSVSYWKSRCEALQFENESLHNYIQNQCMQLDQAKYRHSTFVGHRHPRTHHPQHLEAVKKHRQTEEEEESEDDDDDDFELAPEMVEFINQSQKYKKERKLQKQKEEEMYDEEKGSEVLAEEPIGVKRSREMALMYGKNAPTILAMEAAVQVTFEHNCDRKRPQYWPNMALKL